MLLDAKTQSEIYLSYLMVKTSSLTLPSTLFEQK